MMFYRSTRDSNPNKSLSFSDILLKGLAPDGGLYVPLEWPKIKPETFRQWRCLNYPDLAAEVISLFTKGSSVDLKILQEICHKVYGRFNHKAITPLTEVEEDLFSLELFHGPTLAFKDMAMQVLGELFSYVLKERHDYATIVGATSGDTGSAALEAFKGLENVRIVILHPYQRTSEVQRRQMTTVNENNVLNIAVKGDFDDCQRMVKSMFADEKFRNQIHLSAVNSINWARIAAQIPYYIRSALTFGAPDREISFAVPTGNFGNIFAAWSTKKMGLPVRKLCVGSNKNDILTRFIMNNDMSMKKVIPSLSPSMDIQISSNFERLLFQSLNCNAEECSKIMSNFLKNGKMDVSEHCWKDIKKTFSGIAFDDQETLHLMKMFNDESHYVTDPHSAISLGAGKKYKENGIPMIAAATAHPAKFSDAVKNATGYPSHLPKHLKDIFSKKEEYTVLPNDITVIKEQISQHAI